METFVDNHMTIEPRLTAGELADLRELEEAEYAAEQFDRAIETMDFAEKAVLWAAIQSGNVQMAFHSLKEAADKVIQN